AVITETAGVNGIRDELVSERVHLQQRGEPGGVPEVVRVDPSGERRTRRGLDCPDDRIHPAGQLLPEERERQPAEVRAASGTADVYAGGVPGLSVLLNRFLADNRLMHEHVVENAAECVPGLGVARGDLDRLTYRDTEAAGRAWVLGQNAPSGV